MSGDVATALALHLVGADLAQYSETAPYTEDPRRPAITFGELPASPVTAVSVTVTSDSRDRDEYNPDVDVRLRFRASGSDIRVVDALAERVYDFLYVPEYVFRPQTWPGGIRVLDVRRFVRAQSVTDSDGNWMRADSYRLTLNPSI